MTPRNGRRLAARQPHHFAIPFFLAVLALGVIFEIAYYQTQETLWITVLSKERIVETAGGGESPDISSKYLVFAEGETFENTDLFWIGKFNSSDIQGQLQPNRAYRVTVYGWRVPYLSMYRNIGKVETP